jgi:hypothetical protein
VCDVVVLSGERSLSWSMAVTGRNPAIPLFVSSDPAHQSQVSTPSRVVCKEEAFQRGAIEMIIQA